MARSLRNTAAQAAADKAAEAEADIQSAINAVISDNLKIWSGAIVARTEAEAALENARVSLGIAKLDAFTNVAAASHKGQWTKPQIELGINAAMRIWAGNETRTNPKTGKEETPEDRLASSTAKRMRSEFELPMRADVRANVATIIANAKKAWDEEGKEWAKDNTAKTPLRDAFFNRFAEMALRHLRDAQSTKEMVGPRGAKVERTIPGTLYKSRDEMVVAAVSKATRAPQTPKGTPTPTPAPTNGSPREVARARLAAVLASVEELAKDYPDTDAFVPVIEALGKITGDQMVPIKSKPAPAEPVAGAAELDAAMDDPETLAAFTEFMKNRAK